MRVEMIDAIEMVYIKTVNSRLKEFLFIPEGKYQVRVLCTVLCGFFI